MIFASITMRGYSKIEYIAFIQCYLLSSFTTTNCQGFRNSVKLVTATEAPSCICDRWIASGNFFSISSIRVGWIRWGFFYICIHFGKLAKIYKGNLKNMGKWEKLKRNWEESEKTRWFPRKLYNSFYVESLGNEHLISRNSAKWLNLHKLSSNFLGWL